jgi:hypothetical protein
MQSLLEFALLAMVGFVALVRVRNRKRHDDVSQLHMRLERAPLYEPLVNADFPAVNWPVTNELKEAASFRMVTKKEALYDSVLKGAADAA